MAVFIAEEGGVVLPVKIASVHFQNSNCGFSADEVVVASHNAVLRTAPLPPEARVPVAG